VPIDAKLLELLVCPVSKASLVYRKDVDELWCRASGLAYPIRDGIPVMLEEEARQLTTRSGRPSRTEGVPQGLRGRHGAPHRYHWLQCVARSP
jgi:uncharacterized protein